MKKRLAAWAVLAIYLVLLFKVMVLKDLPTIRVGHLMLNFGGTNAGEVANFIPFSTILPYLFGYKGLIIAGINLAGNIVLLMPLGFLLPLLYPGMTWRKSLAFGIAAGLSIEILQMVMRVGIFDIDDVILNALGTVIGYGVFVLFTKVARIRERTG